MTKKLLFSLFLFFSLNIFAQKSRTYILGIVKNDSLSTENVHVINKATNAATLTNELGEFKITVKENDTLLFSSIQFENKLIVITPKIKNSIQLIVKLETVINELEEITVKQHDLTGMLAIDSQSYKDSIYEITKSALDFSNIDFSKIVVNEIDEINRAKPPDASRLTNPNIPIGGNILGLLKPLLKPLDKIGQKKREEKRAKQIFEDKSRKVPEKVRAEYGDSFFINTLKIPRNQIDSFILHCMKKGLARLHVENKKIELIELLINESNVYIKNEE